LKSTAQRLYAILEDCAPDRKAVAQDLARLSKSRVLETHAYESNAAVESLAETLSRLGACAELGGHVALRFEIDGPRPDQFDSQEELLMFAAKGKKFDSSGVIPTAWQLAIEDLRTRQPLVARDLDAATEDVRRIYGGYRDRISHRRVYPHGFSAARALDIVVTRHVRDVVADGLRSGKSLSEIAEIVSVTTGWNAGYAATVVNTNVATAFSSGRHRQAILLSSRGVEVGFEFQTAEDERVRDSHARANGLVAKHDDHIWDYLTPPLDFNCRCVLLPVTDANRFDDRALWRLRETGAQAAPGFGGRPNRSGGVWPPR
jgi:SPP1 gp7 family putative phage head morphogenesis protein